MLCVWPAPSKRDGTRSSLTRPLSLDRCSSYQVVPAGERHRLTGRVRFCRTAMSTLHGRDRVLRPYRLPRLRCDGHFSWPLARGAVSPGVLPSPDCLAPLVPILVHRVGHPACGFVQPMLAPAPQVGEQRPRVASAEVHVRSLPPHGCRPRPGRAEPPRHRRRWRASAQPIDSRSHGGRGSSPRSWRDASARDRSR